MSSRGPFGVGPVVKEARTEVIARAKLHYKRLGLDQTGWSIKRWHQFCSHFKGLDEDEVAAVFNISDFERQRWRGGGRGYRKGVPTSTSTHLAWIESLLLQQRGIVSAPVLPFDLMNL